MIIFGLDPYGRNVVRKLMRRGISILGVDFDPEAVRLHHDEGMLTLYGDVEDPELFHELPLDSARLVVSAIPDRDTNLVLPPRVLVAVSVAEGLVLSVAEGSGQAEGDIEFGFQEWSSPLSA